MKQVRAEGLLFDVRPDTSDEASIKDVVCRKTYANKNSFTVQAGENWLDIGANIGAFSVWALSLGARVTAYEPTPSSADLAETNIRNNGFHAAVIRKAVTAKGHAVTFGLSHKLPWRNGELRKRCDEHLEVDGITLAKALKQSRADCLKMDIEGSELAILDETPEALLGLRKFVCEYHFEFDDSTANFFRRMDALRSLFPHLKHRRGLCIAGPKWIGFPAAIVVWAWR